MNETLQKSVAAIIDKGLSSLDTAVSFLSAEIPDLIRQILLWHMTRAGVVALISAAFMYAYYRLIKHAIKNDVIDDVSPLLVIGAVTSIIAFICLIASLMDVLQIAIAPKLYLIEYATSLYKRK
jgi:uncharacterized membrane protein